MAVFERCRDLLWSPPRPTDPDRVHAPLSKGERPSCHPYRPVDRWLANRQARRVLREQARTQHEESHGPPPLPRSTAPPPPLTAARPAGGEPDDVAAVIEKDIDARRPRARYRVTPSARILLTARRLAPDRGWDAILRMQFPQPR